MELLHGTLMLVGLGVVATGGWLTWRKKRVPRVSRLDQAEELHKLGPYDLLRQLGQGNMATVYEARDRRDGSVVALKVVSQSHRQDPVFRRRFQREVELSQPLRHPNIVAVYEAIKLDDDLFMTMEYVDGKQLEEILQAGPLPLKHFPKLAWQMLAAMHFAHKRQLFHRDLKPANIMVTRQGQVKILDFGLAIEAGQDRFTHLGFSMGTPSHMAPEMLTQGLSNAGTDQYALGVVFYQMLTGRCPFLASNPVELGLLHVQSPPPPLREIRAEIPSHWEGLILRMLAKEPQQRFHDLAQIQTLISQGQEA